MKKHPKDKITQRGLQKLLDRRRAMMQYLKRKNVETYYKTLKEIGVRDNIA